MKKKVQPTTEFCVGKVAFWIESADNAQELVETSKRVYALDRVPAMRMFVRLPHDVDIIRRVIVAMPGHLTVSFDIGNKQSCVDFALPARFAGAVSIWVCKIVEGDTADETDLTKVPFGRKLHISGTAMPVSEAYIMEGKPKYATIVVK